MSCTIPGSLLPDIQINLHPAMLQLNARFQANRGERSVAINAGHAASETDIPPRRNTARRRNDVFGKEQQK
jgi:hypothetical protein